MGAFIRSMDIVFRKLAKLFLWAKILFTVVSQVDAEHLGNTASVEKNKESSVSRTA
jgi:hypothetical protein